MQIQFKTVVLIQQLMDLEFTFLVHLGRDS